MYDGKTFYHNTIRHYHSMFGSLFNNISIRRFDVNNVVQQTIKIPIAFAPKEEYIRYIREGTMIAPESGIPEPSIPNAQVQIILPRMSFEMTGYSYDSSRMQSVMHQLRYSSGEGVQRQYMPVPYNFTFDLHLYVKNIDDGLQIVEQILPYFNPTLNWPVKNLPGLDTSITHDIAVELTGNAFEWTYGGVQPAEDRMLVWTMTFVMRAYVFRPSDDKGLIKTAIVDFLDTNNLGKDPEQQVVMKNVTVAVNPTTANRDDPHTIIETNTELGACTD